MSQFKNGATSVPVVGVVGYRLKQEGDASWPPDDRAYGGKVEPRWRRTRTVALVAARLSLPILLTLVLLGAAYLYADALLPLAGWPAAVRNAALTNTDLVLPFTWYSIHLTNRRCGPAYALGHLVAVLVLGGLVMLANPYGVDDWVAAMPVLTLRAVMSFGAAFLVANFVAIVAFDAARGPRWWTAPLVGSLAASLVFSLIYYPAAFAGVQERWTDFVWVHFSFFFVESLVLLAPYCLLRPAMKPMAGYNGY